MQLHALVPGFENYFLIFILRGSVHLKLSSFIYSAK